MEVLPSRMAGGRVTGAPEISPLDYLLFRGVPGCSTSSIRVYSWAWLVRAVRHVRVVQQ
jgi:hypothetical protein